jgi:hypothetical protein
MRNRVLFLTAVLAVLSALLVMVAFAFAIRSITKKERFAQRKDALMTTDANRKFLGLEDRSCAYVKQRLPAQDRGAYDIVNNYVLVGGGSNLPPDACYIKSSDTLVDHDCSKTNVNIYQPQHSSVVADVYPKLLADPYVAESLPQEVCVFQFAKDKNDDTETLKDFLQNMDDNLPKVKALRKTIKVQRDRQTVLNSVRHNKENQLKDILDRNATLSKTLRERNDAIAKLDQGIRDKKDTIAGLSTKLDAARVKPDVIPLYATVCAEKDFKNCVYFPVGVYDFGAMLKQGLANDELSSIKVPPGLSVRLFSEALDADGNGGKYMDIAGRNTSYIGNEKWMDGTRDPNPNDSISSLTVTAKAP